MKRILVFLLVYFMLDVQGQRKKVGLAEWWRCKGVAHIGSEGVGEPDMIILRGQVWDLSLERYA
ncbi:MAG: hypothetical protein ACLUPL_14180 [Butyricimonas virosa]